MDIYDSPHPPSCMHTVGELQSRLQLMTSSSPTSPTMQKGRWNSFYLSYYLEAHRCWEYQPWRVPFRYELVLVLKIDTYSNVLVVSGYTGQHGCIHRCWIRRAHTGAGCTTNHLHATVNGINWGADCRRHCWDCRWCVGCDHIRPHSCRLLCLLVSHATVYVFKKWNSHMD